MALIVEDGTGVSGADSYAAISFIDAYWANRQHDPLYTTWNGATPEKKEGAAREATSFLDAEFEEQMRGSRTANTQARAFPRTGANDDSGTALAALPHQVPIATAELAARAVTKRLAKDLERGGKVKRIKIEGAVEKEFTDGAPGQDSHGFVVGILAPILVSGASSDARWLWK